MDVNVRPYTLENAEKWYNAKYFDFLLHNYKLMNILNIKLRIWIFFESITASHVQSPLYDTVSHYHTGPIYMRENITVERPPYATGIEHHSYIYEAMWAKIR